jgi:DNA replication and repair protein RecF
VNLYPRLSRLSLREFRCFTSLEYGPGSRLSFLTGPNARGKTSILEAACVLLRLRSPRTAETREMVRFGREAFALEGMLGETRLSLAYSPPSRVLKIDGVVQSKPSDYLDQGRIVWFGSDDLLLVNGPAERRRKLLDSAGLQLAGDGMTDALSYARDLKTYERALRSRNLLLREGKPRSQIEAYDIPLSEAGDRLLAAREALVSALAPLAGAACRGISGEALELSYQPGCSRPMREALMASRSEEIRLRQTRVGPQRDEVGLLLNGIPAGSFASEGQRRTIALALKLGVAALLAEVNKTPPLLLLDDIFGELDPGRRNALLAGMPAESQAILTTADLGGITLPSDSVVHRFTDSGLEAV